MTSTVRTQLEGFLFYKQPSNNQWTKYWFHLTKQGLSYFERQEKGQAVGKIDIKDEPGAKMVVHENSSVPTYRQNLFEIEMFRNNESQDRHIFSATTPEDKLSWIYILENMKTILTQKKEETPPPAAITPTPKRNSSGNPPKPNPRKSVMITGPVSYKLGGKRSPAMVVPAPPPIPNEADLIVEDSEVKSATVEKLIECLFNSTYSSAQYMTDFLLSYRAFATPMEVLTSLTESYKTLKEYSDQSFNQYKKGCRLRICNFLKKWVTDHNYDFEGNSEFINTYLSFIEEHVNESDPKLGVVLKQKMIQKTSQSEQLKRDIIFSTQPPSPILPRGITQPNALSTGLVLDDINMTELARQMTVIHYGLYKAIQSHEFFNSAWMGAEKETKSPNIVKMSNEFNNISKWIASIICFERNIKQRTSILRTVIKLAQECQKLNNFYAVFAITSGLQNSAVHRLKKTQESLPPDIKKAYDDLLTLTDALKSWKNYRDSLHTINPPCVPFLGVYQTDLTFISEGNQAKKNNGLINFKKCRMMAGVIKEIQQYQHKPYNLVIVQCILNWFTEAVRQTRNVTDKELFDSSLQAEARSN